MVQTGDRGFMEDVAGIDGRTVSTQVRMGAGGRGVPTRGGSCQWPRPAGAPSARHQDADQIETVPDVVDYAKENKN